MPPRAVERHLAQALRIYPGKTNAAMFFVGNRKDGYRFDLTGWRRSGRPNCST
jgi:hypothetical protein